MNGQKLIKCGYRNCDNLIDISTNTMAGRKKSYCCTQHQQMENYYKRRERSQNQQKKRQDIN